jgi:uncharacterized protein (UPF0548 family)
MIMFLVTRPTDRLIERFLSESRDLPLTYAPLGLAQDGAAGYDVDVTTTVIGHGREGFERARAALSRWTHFDLGWVRLYPADASVATGTTVAVLIRHLGFWSLNGARVVYQLENSATRFGFAYGTVATHAESGEEIFEVGLDAESGEVTYTLRAASRPRAPLARLGYPIARILQARFRRDSARVMTSRVRPGSDPGLTPV